MVSKNRNRLDLFLSVDFRGIVEVAVLDEACLDIGRANVIE